MTKQVRARLGLLMVAFLTLGIGMAKAQFNASLSGTVQDSTGAIIPHATVTLTNPDTHAVQTVQSSDGGSYRFSELPAGSYTIKVTATGFKDQTLAGVAIAAETPRNVDVKLQNGGASESVTVDADTVPLLQTADASIGRTIDSEEIRRLPIVGADPYELLRTAPGISGDGARSGNGQAVFLPNGAGPGGSNSGVYQTENQVQISADGQRVSDNNYMIDGVSVNSLTHGGAAVVSPNEEAVGAITIVSSSYDASLGRNTGAQIQVVTKSGTNNLHGSLFFLYDQPGLNSFNKFGGPIAGTPLVRNENQQRTWAASIGGPVIKDKLFFFASFQEYKLKDPSFATAYVETTQYRAAVAANRPGGVSAGILAHAGSQSRFRAVLTPTCTGYGGPCAVVAGGLDLGSLTPGGASQLGVFPATAAGGGLDGIPDVQNVQVVIPNQSRGNQYNARIDWQITPKDLLAGSVYFTKLDNLGASGTAGSRPFDDIPFKPLNSAATLIYIHTFSANWLNEFRVNGTRFADNALNDSGNSVDYGLPYVNVQDYPFAVQYGVQASTATPANFAENTYEARDTVTHSFGSHNLRVGFEARLEQDNDDLSGYERPTYAFDGLWTFANDASVFEQAYANTTTGGVANTQRYLRSQDYAAFIQHDWKVSPNLTFNAGLRWEMFTPLTNKGFDINYPVLGPAGSELSGMKLVLKHQLWNSQHNNWGPKVGFAWTPKQFNNNIVIRGGYALAYNRLDVALFNNAVENGPGVALFNQCCGGNGNPAGILYARGSSNSPTSFPINPAFATGVNANGFPNSGSTVEVYGAQPNLKYPSSDLYSLEVQQQLGRTMTFTMGYAGSSGRHYARLVNQNFLYNQTNTPVFAAYFAQTDSVMKYNSLNLQLQRQMRHGVEFNVVYTWSKGLDQVSNGDLADGAANQTNPADNRSEYGPTDYDLRHRVVATVLYTTPKIHHHNAIVESLINGYQANATYTYHTGFPWTPVTSALSTTPTNGAAAQNVTRPTQYFGGAGDSCSNDAWTSGSNFPNRFNSLGANVGGANYFKQTLPASGVYSPGIGRNSFRGPCYQDLDISVAKEFAHDFGERHTLLRLQANIFNLPNELQLAPIGNNSGGSNINSSTFGQSQSGDSGRVIELLARFQF